MIFEAKHNALEMNLNKYNGEIFINKVRDILRKSKIARLGI